jgi:hypothetical protein
MAGKNTLKFSCIIISESRMDNMLEALRIRNFNVLNNGSTYLQVCKGEATFHDVDVDFQDSGEITYAEALQRVRSVDVKERPFDIEFKDEVLFMDEGHDDSTDSWEFGVFSRVHENRFILAGGRKSSQIVPFQGNEDLLGSEYNPEWWWECEDSIPEVNVKRGR